LLELESLSLRAALEIQFALKMVVDSGPRRKNKKRSCRNGNQTHGRPRR
jgi:hypothetical protein